VSHQIGAVRRLCTAACLLKGGQTEGITSVDAAVNEYSSSMKESAFDLDLSGVARKGDSGQSAKILRIRIAPESSFRYGEPLDLIFTIECRSPITNANVGICFDSLDGYRVLTLDADNNTPATSLKLPAGTHEVRLKVDRNPLHPTTYSFGVYLASGIQWLDGVEICAVWEVSPGGHGLENRGYAGCRLPVNVCVTTAQEI
jgi:lipopolysaccharide transport system ATP-binding protein